MDFLGLLPEAAAEHAPQMRWVLVLVFAFIGLVFMVLFAVFLAALWRSRSERPEPGAKSRLPYLVEGVIFACEVTLFLAIALPFWQTQVEAAPDPGAEPLVVRVVAQQFVWNIHYPGPDGVFGSARAELVDEVTNPLGLDADDPNGLDDIANQNQLHLPVDRPVLIRLTSKDVIHSFAIPEMWVKRDAIPGMVTQVYFTPTMTTAELREAEDDPGRVFEIVCSQLCGQGHYRMRGFVTVETEEDFAAWLAAQPPALPEDDFWN